MSACQILNNMAAESSTCQPPVITSPLTSVTGIRNRAVMLQVLHSQVNTLSSSGTVRPSLINCTQSIATGTTGVSINRFIKKHVLM